ncbi:hypothetical protein [Wolbachia endosymbiont of Brugia pahangi]|uniref:hypothetical protein n=1 Tax=Wolbachia endosymbiont of Brugia pahangi TaxID=96495 RepID=UPI00143B13B7|nr:hypothetical protein [Wolbachia endosymbiont of Brugia pahangi]
MRNYKKPEENLLSKKGCLNTWKQKKARDIAVSSIAAHTEALHENLILKDQQIESSPTKDAQRDGK